MPSVKFLLAILLLALAGCSDSPSGLEPTPTDAPGPVSSTNGEPTPSPSEPPAPENESAPRYATYSDTGGADVLVSHTEAGNWQNDRLCVTCDGMWYDNEPTLQWVNISIAWEDPNGDAWQLCLPGLVHEAGECLEGSSPLAGQFFVRVPKEDVDRPVRFHRSLESPDGSSVAYNVAWSLEATYEVPEGEP